MSSIQKILESKYYQLAVGFFIVCSSLYDLRGDFGKLQKEHFNLLIGIIAVVDSLNDFISSTHKILYTVNKKQFKKEPGTLKRFFNSGGYFLFAGTALFAGSMYDIYTDILKIRKEHLELVAGILYVVLTFENIRGAGKKIKSGIHKSRVKSIPPSIWLHL